MEWNCFPLETITASCCSWKLDHPQNINGRVLSFIPATFIKMLCTSAHTWTEKKQSLVISCVVYGFLKGSWVRLSVYRLSWTESVGTQSICYYLLLFCVTESSLHHMSLHLPIWCHRKAMALKLILKITFDDFDKTTEFRTRNIVAYYAVKGDFLRRSEGYIVTTNVLND